MQASQHNAQHKCSRAAASCNLYNAGHAKHHVLVTIPSHDSELHKVHKRSREAGLPQKRPAMRDSHLRVTQQHCTSTMSSAALQTAGTATKPLQDACLPVTHTKSHTLSTHLHILREQTGQALLADATAGVCDFKDQPLITGQLSCSCITSHCLAASLHDMEALALTKCVLVLAVLRLMRIANTGVSQYWKGSCTALCCRVATVILLVSGCTHQCQLLHSQNPDQNCTRSFDQASVTPCRWQHT